VTVAKPLPVEDDPTLLEKIEDNAADPQRIQTVRGIGHRFEG
jgi:DNA-binding response OmpR family regulator